jgi:teichuronic acid biosynthesis glycosyltransferase TuaC
MKVLVISHMYPSTFSEIGGIFVHQQVKELQKQGCEVKVISPIPWSPFPIKHLSRKWKRYADVPDKSIWEGVEVYYPRFLQFPRNVLLASSGKRMYSGIRKVVDKLYQDFKFDVIHAHVALPDGFAGMMIKQEYNIPLVVTIHGVDLYGTIHRNDSCRRSEGQVFRVADRIVLVSTELNQIARSNIGFPEKLNVVSNGIDPTEVAIVSDQLRSTYAGQKVIVSVSYLIARKGLGFNIKSVAQLADRYPDMKYLVIGDGPEANSLKRLVSDLNLENMVGFLGALSHSKVMEYMALADLLSLPSWNEAFGMVYIEAMAHGKPVIACEGEGITDVIENGKTGLLVKPKDVDSLAQAMDFLLSNPEKAHEIGERARKLVLETYTWEKNARRYVEIYRELLANHG